MVRTADDRTRSSAPEKKGSRSGRMTDLSDDKAILVELSGLGVRVDTLSERIDRMESRIDRRLEKQDVKIETLFEKQDTKIDRLEIKMNDRFDKQDSKITNLETRVLSLEKKIFGATAVVCVVVIAVNIATKLF